MTKGQRAFDYLPEPMLPEWVTPDKAAAYLRRLPTLDADGKQQRDAIRTKIEEYKRDMLAGRWEHFTCVGFHFDDRGRLWNGRQRCTAVVESGVTIGVYVKRGGPPPVGSEVDTNAKRTLGHILRMNGEKNYNQLAAAICWVWKYHNGCMRSATRPSNAEALAELGKYPETRRAVAEVMRLMGSARIVPVGVAAALYVLTCRVSEIDGEIFAAKLLGGVELLRDEYAVTARQYLVNLRAKSYAGHRADSIVYALVYALGWNRYRAGERARSYMKLNLENYKGFPALE